MKVPYRSARPYLVAFASVLSSSVLAQSYRVDTIPGSPWAGGSSATALGNNGYVVAQTGLYHNGSVTQLPTLNGRTVSLVGVNGAGNGVGSYQTDTFTAQGYLYAAARYDGGSMSAMNVAGTSTEAQYLGDDGTIMGTSLTYPNSVTVAHAWVLRKGVMTTLQTRSDLYSSTSAVDINASGVVVGSAEGPLGNYYFHAARWENNHLQDLGTGGSNFGMSTAAGISDAGDILVTSYRDYYSGDGIGQSFIWSNGTMTALPTFGGSQSTAGSMNALGEVVGSAKDAVGDDHPFLWDKAHGLTSLDHVLDGTGYYGLKVGKINDQGQILGTAFERTAQGYSVGWAVLLTPQAVPEPATYAALGLGTLGLCRRRRRR